MPEEHPYSFAIEARVTEPGKFGWSILEGSERIRASLSSFENYEEAEQAAVHELDRLVAIWNIEHHNEGPETPA
jgi:hypothetical protein